MLIMSTFLQAKKGWIWEEIVVQLYAKTFLSQPSLTQKEDDIFKSLEQIGLCCEVTH